MYCATVCFDSHLLVVHVTIDSVAIILTKCEWWSVLSRNICTGDSVPFFCQSCPYSPTQSANEEEEPTDSGSFGGFTSLSSAIPKWKRVCIYFENFPFYSQELDLKILESLAAKVGNCGHTVWYCSPFYSNICTNWANESWFIGEAANSAFHALSMK